VKSKAVALGAVVALLIEHNPVTVVARMSQQRAIEPQ
jgi:hypothetical protein